MGVPHNTVLYISGFFGQLSPGGDKLSTFCQMCRSDPNVIPAQASYQDEKGKEPERERVASAIKW